MILTLIDVLKQIFLKRRQQQLSYTGHSCIVVISIVEVELPYMQCNNCFCSHLFS